MAKNPNDAVVLGQRFSPKGGCTDYICQAINSATKEILVMAYEFTSAPICQSLVAALGRKVTVKLVHDKLASLTKTAEWPVLLKTGGQVYFDGKHRIMHDKVLILDGKRVLTGSFNFTEPAEDDHAENIVLLEGHELATLYTANFNLHLAHAVPATEKHLAAHAAAMAVLPDFPIAPEQLAQAPAAFKALL